MAECIHIEVTYSPEPDRVQRCCLALPAGSTVADALCASHLQQDFPGCADDPESLAVFSRPVGMDYPLHDGDRVEVCRPLFTDPKDARRHRARSQP